MKSHKITEIASLAKESVFCHTGKQRGATQTNTKAYLFWLLKRNLRSNFQMLYRERVCTHHSDKSPVSCTMVSPFEATVGKTPC